MNIGETDGWTCVSFGDAAKAAQDKTHDVQELDKAYDVWRVITSVFTLSGVYRIREKARTITVTIPRPVDAWPYESSASDTAYFLGYKTTGQRDEAAKAIRVAMEQS